MSVSKLYGVSVADIAKINGVDIANIAKFNGVDISLGVALHPFYQAALTHMSGQGYALPTEAEQTRDNLMIQTLDDNNLLTQLASMHIFDAANGSNSQLTDYVSLDTAKEASLIGSPVRSSDGINTEGVNQAIELAFVPVEQTNFNYTTGYAMSLNIHMTSYTQYRVPIRTKEDLNFFINQRTSGTNARVDWYGAGSTKGISTSFLPYLWDGWDGIVGFAGNTLIANQVSLLRKTGVGSSTTVHQTRSDAIGLTTSPTNIISLEGTGNNKVWVAGGWSREDALIVSNIIKRDYSV